ncbi:hypothetical protein TNCV_2812841 [Trichonephila clavipes]|nr:hypothetical protein TNCV_2812841 [Trichonephila clavipes]
MPTFKFASTTFISPKINYPLLLFPHYHLQLKHTSSIAGTVSKPQPPVPVSNNVLSTTNNVSLLFESSSIVSASPSNSGVQPPSASILVSK